MRKPEFIGCEQQRLRPACASTGLINALKSIWKAYGIKNSYNLSCEILTNLAIFSEAREKERS